MSTFQERLQVEKQELNDKFDKLYSFIHSENFSKINPVQQSLLRVQLLAMETYAKCLSERIVWLEKETISG